MKMKNFIAGFIMLLLGLSNTALNAQNSVLPNGDFESWNSNLPAGWKTLSIPMVGIISSVAKTNDAQSGLAAVELKTKTASVMGTEEVTIPGLLTNADIDVMALMQVLSTWEQSDSVSLSDLFTQLVPCITGGTFISGTPTSFNGYYKYTPSGTTDYCFLLSLFLGNNAAGMRTVVGISMHIDSVASDTYKEFSAPYVAMPLQETIQPNEVVVLLLSSFVNMDQDDSPVSGSKLKVDNVSLVINSVELPIVSSEKTNLVVYPNPSSGTFRLTGYDGQSIAIQVTDIKGRTMLEKENYRGESLSLPSAGIYFVKVIGKEFSTVRKITIK